MNYPGTKKTAMLLGTMAAETTLEMIYGKLAEDHPEIEAVDISVISQDKDAVYLSVFCMKDQAADVENTLRTAGFSRPVVSTEQIPAKQKEELEEQIRKIEQTIADIRGEIISYGEHFRSPDVHLLSVVTQQKKRYRRSRKESGMRMTV